jgi:DNA-binding transcriptional MocR family regulator
VITKLDKYIDDVQKPKGGYFLWIKLKPEFSALKLAERMDTYKVKFHHGNKFSSNGTADNYIRLSYSWYTEADEYKLGVSRLKMLFEEY